ncbi:MAG TPA: glyoxalase/bleomycin resistance/dioxygenase family protein [Sneathiellales bacterium]|nr:glyoxalase/bleomycin resistance/dioxygenase family protein [Sneathiellales bacterium]
MNRFHVHVAVPDLDKAVRFYSTMFKNEPVVLKHDYAKWLLDDPRINFAISVRGRATGLDHLGLQVESDEELVAKRAQLASADENLVTQTATACCYSESDKYWISDPAGIAWETFHTLGEVPVFGDDTQPQTSGTACSPEM